MSGAAFFRVKKLTGAGIIKVAASHNRRTIAAEIGAAGHIDASRCHLNVTLVSPTAAMEPPMFGILEPATGG